MMMASRTLPSTGGKSRRLETAVRRAAAGKQIALAVSGGRDSMALLHAVARASPRSIVAVATFDHGTGPAATEATELVADEAARLGFPVVIGRANAALGEDASEAEWRAARRQFFADVTDRTGGMIATAHTRDDQVETILMRVLRDAGARGLAGLFARGDAVRPLLEFARDEVAEYADEVGARWIEDPTNRSMRHFRNRVRRDLLPAIARVTPGFDEQLIGLAREAGMWRTRLDEMTGPLARVSASGDRLSVAVDALKAYSREELASLWPAIAARVGLAMDWRGTERAAAFTNRSRTGARIQLSGGWEIARTRHQFELRRWR
ncbi:MAG: tRNA lysidine(34) synthetase TilS [Gemmatimonadaceae bacterium]